MHDHLSPPSWACEDESAQSSVLGFVLEEHPALLTLPELVRAMCKRPEDFPERDAVEQAVHDLVGASLLRCEGASVLPTRAALFVSRLEFG